MRFAFDIKSFLVLVLSAVVLLAWLGTRGLNEPDEGRFAEIGREMALQNSWLVPHLNGVPHFQKPPLLYWVTACSIRAFGVNEWAVRLPVALAAFGTLACMMLIAGILFGPSVRWMSGLMLLTSAGFFTVGRIVTTDMMLTFWITAAIAGLVVYVRRGQGLGLVMFYVCIGLAFLTKGPLGLIIPASAAVAWQMSLRRTPHAKVRLFWLVGLPLSIAIGFSWFLLLCQRYPELYDYFVKYEFIQRIATNVHQRHKPFWFFVPILAGGFLPWTCFLPSMIPALCRRGVWSNPIAWLFSGWIVVPFVVLSCVSSKLATYVLPLLPPLSMVVARLWREACLTTVRRGVARATASVFLLVVVALPVVAVHANTNLGYRIPLGLPVYAGLAFSVALFAASIGMVGNSSFTRRFLPLFSGGVLVLFLVLVSRADSLLQSGNTPMRELAQRIQQERSGPTVPVFACDLRSNGIEFYTGQLISRSKTASDVVLPMDAELASRIIGNSSEYVRALAAKEAFVVVKAKRYQMDSVFAGWDVLMRAGTCVLIRPCQHVPACVRPSW